MFGTVRRLAPWILGLMLIAMGLTMGASAAGNSPSASGLVTTWAEWIVGNAIALLGGIIAWTQLTIHSVRRIVAQEIMSHDGLEGAHKVASSHNHEPFNKSLHNIELLIAEINGKLNMLVEGVETTMNDLAEQDTRLATVERGLEKLLSEHCFLHGQALRHRSTDAPGFSPDNVRGVDDGV